jgi:3-oxoacyl-[acyl-carrier protein] reductase
MPGTPQTGQGNTSKKERNLNLEISGKIAIVGGSSKGIGFAAARSIAHEGGNVTIVARHGDELEAAATKLRTQSTTDSILPVVGDLANPDDIQRVYDETMAHWGRVDIVVNNLGGPPPGQIMEFTDEQWQLAFDLNFSSAMRMNRLVLPGMIERRHGRIIAVLSRTIKEPEDRLGLSTVARSALSSYSKLLAQDVAADGITVNNVLPGSVATDRLQSVIGIQAKANNRTVEAQEAFRLASVPAGRFGDPDELGDVIAFLASARAGFITAQNIAVDGGQIKGLSA